MSIDSIAISDFKELHALKRDAQTDAKAALPEVAKQFEGIFLQSMLKSMRMSQHFVDDNNPLRGKNQETFQEMLDAQYISQISEGRGIGLAKILCQQLEKTLPQQDASAPVNQKVDHLRYYHGAQPDQMLVEKSPIASSKDTKTSGSMSTIDDFVQSIWPYARQAASVLGLDPKILLAQAALETGWGRHIIKDEHGVSSNNLFNVKAPDMGKGIAVQTKEYIENTPVDIKASFKRYATPAHSFNDYITLLKGDNRYEAALANANDPQRYIMALQQAGYATDPGYASKILSIFHGDELNSALARHGYLEK